ncbi:hypothetical protein Pla175_18100 [Pirellulimonas nuda]|uniref:MoxR-vWA-beta-propeller ternary system domain-containing protein n=1 Tax=Pirellulimonas nuda TaxID=2528009 RepID=A0A518DAD2_9BACT|nr:hypothetical protein [Pirellulimonas nuda]QDU88432.1 hypothetical protein Pla175_18100 [Pirellulimonas nuda]
MPQIELAIRPRAAGRLDTAAWFIPGASPQQWIEEIASWRTDQRSLRIIAIREQDSLLLAGALAIPSDSDCRPSGRCVAYGRLGENLYLPTDAELRPAVPLADVAGLFAEDYLYVWTPGRGLTAAGPLEVFSLGALVRPPAPTGDAWESAVPGVGFPSMIVAILPHQTPTADGLLDDARDGIGDHGDDLARLPKSPDESLLGASGAAIGAALSAAAKALRGMTGLVRPAGSERHSGDQTPARSGAGSRGTGGALDRWLTQLRKSLQAARNKEVARLLGLLENDPDQGLKYALPIDGSGGAHRGRSLPGARLGMHNTDFSLGRMRGGGAADVWDLPFDYQQQLIAKYRELAAREARLGRYRRAAYIYAELLGDYNAAASTLEQGRCFREAAVLYRDRLKNDQAAAECLERGELWAEAIDAYRALEQHEKVGDLFRHIQQNDAASDAYHAAADAHLLLDQRLEAARIYDEKLREPDRAIATLDGGWPAGLQAKTCVQAALALRGRLGRHDSARERITELARCARQLARHAEVAGLLADVFERYADRGVRGYAAEVSSQIIANRLRLAPLAEVDSLLATLARLVPGDPLLPRDGRQYVQNRKQYRPAPLARQAIVTPTTAGRIERVHQFELGLGDVWKAAAVIGDSIFVAGIDHGLVFARCDGRGNVERRTDAWLERPLPMDTELVMLGEKSPIHLLPIGAGPLPMKEVFAGCDAAPSDCVWAGTPKGHGVVWGAAVGSLGQIWSIEGRNEPDAVLVCVNGEGAVVATRSLRLPSGVDWQDVSIPVPIHATSLRVFVGVGNSLIYLQGDEARTLERFERRIVGLAGGGPYASPNIAVSLDAGAAVVRPGFGGSVVLCAESLRSPKLLISQGGFLVAADDQRIEAYQLNNRAKGAGRVALRGATVHDAGRPIAVLPGRQTDEFVVVTGAGSVSVYRLLI